MPLHSDRALFELLCLEGAQAGLSWWTILRKRRGYRRAFARFNIKKVASFKARSVETLVKNPEIVRHKLKIQSVISNARAILKIQREFGSLDAFLWQFVANKPIQSRLKRTSGVNTRSRESDAMSAALRSAGLSFVGTTICYAFMQAAGLVNDHSPYCFRWREVRALALLRT